MQLLFRRVGETRVRCDYRAERYLVGPPDVIHGGIQATLLDEVLGTTAHTAIEEHVPASLVTAEFALRYRRPVPVEVPIAIIGDLVRVEGRNHFVQGRIENAAGEVLTTAEARWVRLDLAP